MLLLNLTIAKYHPSGATLGKHDGKEMVHAIQPVSLVIYMTPSINLSPAEIYPTSTGKNIKWQSY